MRIVRVKLNKQAEEFIELVAQKMRVKDYSFIQDLYALVRLRGNGLPDDARCEKLAEAYAKGDKLKVVVTRSLIKKRRQILTGIRQLAMFSAFIKNPIENELEFTETLLRTFRKIHRKIRQAECLSCSLLSQCEFGKQYGSSVTRITVVIDPDYAKKVHQDCPSLPEIEFINEISKAMEFAAQMGEKHNAAALKNAVAHPPKYMSGFGGAGTEEDEETTKKEIEKMSNAEAEAKEEDFLTDDDIEALNFDERDFDDFLEYGIKNNRFSKWNKSYATRHSGGLNVYLNEQAIDKLKVSSLVIFELAKKLDSLLTAKKKGQFKPVAELTQDRQIGKIKSVAEAPKVIASQQALPEVAFTTKLVKKELVKRQQIKPEEKKQLLYLLIDCSDSMNSAIGNSPLFGYVSRAALAASFSIALSRRVMSDKGMLFSRCFEGSPDQLRSCRQDAEFLKFETYISECSFDGYSTNIKSAVHTAIEDIHKSKDELAKSEILLISDCCDSIDATETALIRDKLGRTALNVLDVSGLNDSGRAVASLKELSDNYYKVDSSKNSLNDMIELIGGKKKGQVKGFNQ